MRWDESRMAIVEADPTWLVGASSFWTWWGSLGTGAGGRGEQHKFQILVFFATTLSGYSKIYYSFLLNRCITVCGKMRAVLLLLFLSSLEVTKQNTTTKSSQHQTWYLLLVSIAALVVQCQCALQFIHDFHIFLVVLGGRLVRLRPRDTR